MSIKDGAECVLIKIVIVDGRPQAQSAIDAPGASAYDLGRMLGLASVSIEKQLAGVAESIKKCGGSNQEVQRLCNGFQDAMTQSELVAEQGSVRLRRR